MRERWTGRSERAPTATTAQLEAGLEELRKNVVLAAEQRVVGVSTVAVRFSSFVNDSGYECVHDGTRCQGDCRDTIYAKATVLEWALLCNVTHIPCSSARDHSQLSATEGDSYFVIGVNHKYTNQSLYSSVTAYDFPRLAAAALRKGGSKPSDPVTYTAMDTDLRGSAFPFLSGELQRTVGPYLYAVEFSRNCTSPSMEQRAGSHLCYNVPSAASSPDEPVLNTTSPVVFIERMYIRPGSASGPAVAETILPYLIHVRQR